MVLEFSDSPFNQRLIVSLLFLPAVNCLVWEKMKTLLSDLSNDHLLYEGGRGKALWRELT